MKIPAAVYAFCVGRGEAKSANIGNSDYRTQEKATNDGDPNDAFVVYYLWYMQPCTEGPGVFP